MRNLDECKAEILRRAEDKKRKSRKKHSRMLMISISLAICFTVFLVMFFMDIMPDRKDENTNHENRVCSYTTVKIEHKKGAGSDIQKITDISKIDKIFSTIHSLCINEKEEVAIPTEDDFSSTDSVDGPNAIIEFTGFTIVFCKDDKSEVVYTLEENILRSVNENLEVKIDDMQLTMLKNMLGISK